VGVSCTTGYVAALVPYYASTNRGPVDMLVWIPETTE
jgi:DUF1680 family protein